MPKREGGVIETGDGNGMESATIAKGAQDF